MTLEDHGTNQDKPEDMARRQFLKTAGAISAGAVLAIHSQPVTADQHGFPIDAQQKEVKELFK